MSFLHKYHTGKCVFTIIPRPCVNATLHQPNNRFLRFGWYTNVYCTTHLRTWVPTTYMLGWKSLKLQTRAAASDVVFFGKMKKNYWKLYWKLLQMQTTDDPVCHTYLSFLQEVKGRKQRRQQRYKLSDCADICILQRIWIKWRIKFKVGYLQKF